MKKQDWIFWGLVLVLVGFLLFRKSREGFASVNPIPTQDEWNSGIDGSSPNMQKLKSYIAGLPWPNGSPASFAIALVLNYVINDAGGLSAINSWIASYTSRPTFKEAVEDFFGLLHNPLSGSVPSQIISNGPTENPIGINGAWYAAYKYIFGNEPPPSMSGKSTPSMSGKTSAPAPSLIGVPEAAPSKGTPISMPSQSPCQPRFLSVPGGINEVRCFS
jgi:hypothetical protein